MPSCQRIAMHSKAVGCIAQGAPARCCLSWCYNLYRRLPEVAKAGIQCSGYRCISKRCSQKRPLIGLPDAKGESSGRLQQHTALRR